MFPGGRMNPKQMKAAMRRMGITQEEMSDVEEVVIRTKQKELVIKDAMVTAVTMQGQVTYQIMGTPEERERREGDAAAGTEAAVEEDVKLVMTQTDCSEEEARRALKECDGAPAEAILKIMTSR
ncbi:MAG: nascent polypeptide-associated complex protein [Methanobacteriota archaeon]|nr:MAG: nascent polypeptide-associated complex protein [Euryarchaeota archaeon]